jgi:SAM-dependent methyltransferase
VRGTASLVDRECRPGTLDNRLRRWVAPPRTEVDPLGISAGATVADLGAGVGYFAAEILRRIGPSGILFLVDLDAENLEIARRRVGADPRAHWMTGSAARLEGLTTGSVDAVLLSLVLCCLVDKEGAMDETWRILRPGGRVLVTFPRMRLVPPFRRRSLRVTDSRWTELRRRRPWESLPVPRGRIVRRFLLRKPPGSSAEGAGAGGSTTASRPPMPTASIAPAATGDR